MNYRKKQIKKNKNQTKKQNRNQTKTKTKPQANKPKCTFHYNHKIVSVGRDTQNHQIQPQPKSSSKLQ